MRQATFILLIFTICSHAGMAQEKFMPKYLAILAPSKGPLLINQCSRSSPGPAKNFWAIGPNEKKLLQSKFKRLYVKLTRQCCGMGDHFSKLSFQDYCFQCVGVIIHHKKFIYINAIRLGPNEFQRDDEFKNWQTEPIVICDGGIDFWGILLNVRAKCFSQIDFNGDA